HVDMAASSAASVDLADLERRVVVARLTGCGEVRPDPEEAQTRLQPARQAAADLDPARKVAKGRLSDAQSTFQALAARFEQLADQALAEAERKRDDADKALRGLDEASSNEVQEAEKEFHEAQAKVAHLEEQLTVARTGAEVATQARDDARTNR